MKLYHIISSVLSAFFGVQNNKKFKEDEDFIEQNGVKYFLIVGFFIVVFGIIVLRSLVGIIVD